MRKIILLTIFIINYILLQMLNAQQYWVPPNPPKSHYKIEVIVDVPNKLIKGTVTVSLPNFTAKELSVIALDWSITDFTKIEISMDGKQLMLLNTNKNSPISSPLVYALPTPIMPGSKGKFQIEFQASNLIGNEINEIKLIEWYPRLWWDGLPIHDSFEVKLNIPSEYAMAVSGRLNNETGYYENNGVESFGIYLGKGLNKKEQVVEGVLITSLFTEQGSQCAELCFETALDVVKFYKEWLGFYPFDFLNIIPGGSEPWGGYPFASGIVVIHGQEKFETKPLLHWKWITAHEIGHQYWGEYVLEVDVPSWLWIGLGIYADREYSTKKGLGLEKHLGIMSRFLDGLYHHYDMTVDIPPAQFKRIEYDHNNIVEHGKSFSIISSLENSLGKDVFEKIYRKCLKDYGGKRLGYREFWRVCEEVSGENLSWFFEQWVRSNKYPAYKIISQQCREEDGLYVSYITVKSLGSLKMPVPVKIIFEDGSSQIKFTNRLLDINYLRFESKSNLKEAILNPDKKLAMLDSTLTPFPDELYDLITQLPYTGAGEAALKAFQQAKDLKLAFADPWFKLGMTLFDGGYFTESFEAFKKNTELNPSEIYYFTSLVWLGHLKDLMEQREEALKYYNDALKNDTGRTMRHDQYGLKINRQWVEERLKTPFQWGKGK